MNKPHRNPWALVRAIFEAGRSAILMWVCVQIALLVIAVVVGVIGWMAHGFLYGLVYAMFAFGVGEAIAALIIEMIWELPEQRETKDRLLSNQEELDALRSELDQGAEENVTPSR